MSGGDISLSQSLGGLRIANPDETTASPSPPIPDLNMNRPPAHSSHSSSSTVTASFSPTSLQRRPSTQLPQTSSQTSPDIAPYISNSSLSTVNSQDNPFQPPRLIHRQSMPLAQQAQQQSHYPPQIPSNNIQIPRQYPPTVARPISGIYNHPNASNSSQASSYSAYRYGDEPPAPPQPPQPPINIMQRSSSRSQPSYPPPSGMLHRDASRRERHLDPQSQQMQTGLAGPAPPRRSSRRGPPGVVPHNPSYGLESGSLPTSGEDWKERGAAVNVRQEVDANGNRTQRVLKKGVKDFNFGRTLGEGSYSTVLAATDRQTLREYAVKVLDKRHIIKEKKVKYVNIERDTLNRLTDHPGIVRLYYTFQDEASLYFVLDVASNGELLGVLKRLGTFDLECAQFYSAQILDAIEYMHSRGVIHRDLKPENVLLDANMHVKITDFGTAKVLDSRPKDRGTGFNPGDPMEGAETDRAMSFVGTAEYVSPELLTDKNACKASDLWAFGCIVYQLLAGKPPFKAANEYLTFQLIVGLEYTFPEGFPDVARDLVERLLVLDPVKRLPIEHIKNHAFFDGITWGRGLWKQKAPRLRSFSPEAQAPISLNAPLSSAPPPIPTASHAPAPTHPRPTPPLITELPPPSQLDIDWSPVLTRTNERILKLGNLVVTSHAQAHSPTNRNGESTTTDTPKKFARFFGGNTTKKRQRLVMITSSGRVIVVAAGGDEKKAKLEVSLLSPGVGWRTTVDSKGLTSFVVDTKDKHITFEDPQATAADPDGSKYNCQEWIEMLERAREFAYTQSLTTTYPNDSTLSNTLNELSSLSSPSDGGLDAPGELSSGNALGRARLRKDEGNSDGDSLKGGRKRFSKRHSKNGLAAVF